MPLCVPLSGPVSFIQLNHDRTTRDPCAPPQGARRGRAAAARRVTARGASCAARSASRTAQASARRARRRRKGDQQREGYIQVIQNLLTTGNHWIGVHLKGQAIGAVVSVIQGGKIQRLPIVTGDSFDSQHPNTAHFGLGKNKAVDVIEVIWPNGKVTRLEKPESDRYHVMGLD